MAQQFRSQSERRFLGYLHEHLGYPATSVVYEPAFHSSAGENPVRPDFAVVDPTRNEYLAVIEVKHDDDTETMQRAATSLSRVVRALGARPLPIFLAVPTPQAFRLYRFQADGSFEQITEHDFPTYDSLRASAAASTKQAVRVDLKATTDRFRYLTWALSVAAVTLGGLDFYLNEFRGITLLNAERLTLIGIATALSLLPYAAKLKAFGLEFQRWTGAKQPDDGSV